MVIEDSRIAPLPLDPNAFVARHLTPQVEAAPQDSGAVVGHVHLQVGDVATARELYVDTLGFTPTFEVPTALFVSAGGYHHMAMNTWRSAGAARRSITLGLGEVTIEVPSSDDLGALTERLTARGVPLRDDGATVSVDDPWNNVVRVRVSP